MTTTGNSTSRRAFFPGSFNPFTRGHQSLVDRALQLFDEIVIAVGVSIDKNNAGASDLRVNEIRRLYDGNPRVRVVAYGGLTVNAARDNGCGFILRGVRNTVDFEYEKNMADVNRRISGIETVVLFTLPEMSAISSSLVRELRHYGEDVGWLLPEQ